MSRQELVITVVDDVTNVTQTFTCPLNILLDKMKYFRSELNSENSSDEAL